MLERYARLAFVVVGLAIVGLVGLAGDAQAAREEKRVALVIGNNDYRNFQPLTNPVNDAESLKAALESINFDVVYFKNTTLRDFYQALKEFNKRAKDADVAVVYYAGHAVQFKGRNYLIQVDDEAETLDDINIGSIPVDKILDILASVKGVKVLILDACRDNPAKSKQSSDRSAGSELTRDVGLARLDEYDTSSGGGMVIAYATSASHVAEDGEGKNSPFSAALTKWITAPDLTFPDIFTNVAGTVVATTDQRQHPIFDSSLTGKYILNPTGSEWVDWANVRNASDLDKLQRFLAAHPASAHAPVVERQIEVLQESLAESTWSQIKAGADLNSLEAFKAKFPASSHAPEADRAIAALQHKAEDAAREAEAWERAKAANDLDAVQAFRSAYPNSSHVGEADRKVASLKEAIDDRQRADAAWDRLKTSTDLAAVQGFRSAFPNSSHAAEAADRIADLQRKAADSQREAAEWGRVKESLDPAVLQNFLDRYPSSQFVAEAGRKLVEAQQKIVAQRSEKAWDQVKNGADMAALALFRDTYPDSPHAAEVDQRIAAAHTKAESERSEKAWAEVKSSSDAAALQAFSARYPNSPHAAEAERLAGGLQPSPMAAGFDDAVAWDHARKAGSISELQAFKHLFPNSTHLAEADKAIAALQDAAEEEKRKLAEAEKAKRAEEACKQEAADVDDFVKARSASALAALRGRAACAKTIAAIDAALRDIKMQECASEREQARNLGSDLEALRNAVGGFTCDAVIAATRSRIGQLEQEATRVAKACDDARDEVGSRIDPFEAGAREKLEKYMTRTECPAAVAAAQTKIKDLDDRVNAAQAQLKKLGCYAVEPSSARFDKETENAVGRFQRWAHLGLDETHLTSDLVQRLADFAGEGACRAAAPSVAAVPREAPVPRVEPAKPARPRRQHSIESAEQAPARRTAPAPRPAAAPAAPAPSPGAAKSQIFIPN